jgi:hypothetical protein
VVSRLYRSDARAWGTQTRVMWQSATKGFWGCLQNYEKWLIASSHLPACPSVHVEQLGSQWTNFREKSDIRVFIKICQENSQVSFKSDKNSKYFTWRPMNILYQSSSFLLRKKNVSDKSCRKKSQHTFCVL